MKYTKLLSLAAFASFALAAGSAQGAITVFNTDFAKTAGNGSTDFTEVGNTYTYNYAAGSDSDMLVVAATYEGQDFGLSYNGVSMTNAVEIGGGGGVKIFYLANPSAAGNLVLSATGGIDITGIGMGIASLEASEGMAIALDTTATSGGNNLTISPNFDESFVMFGGNANTTSSTPGSRVNSPLTQIVAANNFTGNQGAIGYQNGVSAVANPYSFTSNKSVRGVAAASFYAYAIPEPSSYALLAGCFGLTWVMLRRRR